MKPTTSHYSVIITLSQNAQNLDRPLSPYSQLFNCGSPLPPLERSNLNLSPSPPPPPPSPPPLTTTVHFVNL